MKTYNLTKSNDYLLDIELDQVAKSIEKKEKFWVNLPTEKFDTLKKLLPNKKNLKGVFKSNFTAKDSKAEDLIGGTIAGGAIGFSVGVLCDICLAVELGPMGILASSMLGAASGYLFIKYEIDVFVEGENLHLLFAPVAI